MGAHVGRSYPLSRKPEQAGVEQVREKNGGPREGQSEELFWELTFRRKTLTRKRKKELHHKRGKRDYRGRNRGD